MKKANKLPIFKPFYSVYHEQANGTAILSKNDNAKNWYLNECMNLRCDRHFLYSHTAPNVLIARSSYKLNPFLKKEGFNTKYFGDSLHEVIHKLIDDGYYVVLDGVNEYFANKVYNKKTQPLSADGLIYGYDDRKNIYNVLAYNENHEHTSFNVVQSCFSKANDLAIKNGDSGILYGIKSDGKKHIFSPLLVIRHFAEYLNSSLEIFSPDIAEEAYGTVVHDYIGMYLDGLYDGSIFYKQQNPNIFLVLSEQKRFMLERLIRLETELSMDNKISNEYSEIVKISEELINLYDSYCKMRQDNILPIMKEKILYMKQQEETLLREMIKNVKDIML